MPQNKTIRTVGTNLYNRTLRQNARRASNGHRYGTVRLLPKVATYVTISRKLYKNELCSCYVTSHLTVRMTPVNYVTQYFAQILYIFGRVPIIVKSDCKLHVHLPSCIIAAPTGQICVKFSIRDLYENHSRKYKFG